MGPLRCDTIESKATSLMIHYELILTASSQFFLLCTSDFLFFTNEEQYMTHASTHNSSGNVMCNAPNN